MSGSEVNLKRKGSIRKNAERLLTLVLAAGGLTAILLSLEFNLLEANLYDLRMARGIQAQPSNDIVLITMDQESLEETSQLPPLELKEHARLLENLEKLQPRAVGYLLDMYQVKEVSPKQFDSEWGKRFLAAGQRLIAKGSPFVFGTRFDVTGETLPPFPLATLPHAIALIHKDGNVFGEDKVTRRALSYLYKKPTFHLKLAQEVGAREPEEHLRGSFHVENVDARYFFFRYHGNTALDPETGNLPYERYSFADILADRVPREAIEGKMVLVGSLQKDVGSDFGLTPYSKESLTHPKLAIHANILDTTLQNDGIYLAPKMVNWVTTFIAIAIVLALVFITQPVTGVIATIGLAISFLIVGQILFQIDGLWIRESQPLVGIFLAYYLAVPYRLIREYKSRWDYQKKNEILVQVEEMKTNFLSLVTHDLKTPVARIQGLAEVILRKTRRDQVERIANLNAIIDSTTELNRFISTLLELHKIDSNRLPIDFKSKDVNQLVETAVQSFEPQARQKKQIITTHLEPLFPIDVDPELMSKMINNLIDNAMKYSPEGSEIQVQTSEVDDHVIVSVRDQGIGMSEDELKNLFTRFYRAKNDQTTAIAGTGLGLYLTKYFVEAHQGRIEVESKTLSGSEFRLFIPLTQDGNKAEKNQANQPGLRLNLAKLFKMNQKKKEKRKDV